jgi:thioredoxin-like negative regulator of GroEL
MAELDVDNFEEEVLRNDKVVWVVEFYSDLCPHCRKVAPEMIKAARAEAAKQANGIDNRR